MSEEILAIKVTKFKLNGAKLEQTPEIEIAKLDLEMNGLRLFSIRLPFTSLTCPAQPENQFLKSVRKKPNHFQTRPKHGSELARKNGRPAHL